MTAKYVKTGTILDTILAHKVEEVAAREAAVPLKHIQNIARTACVPRSLLAALRRKPDTVSLIAEVKKASPSKGVLIEDFDPMQLGRVYAQNGAAAISVLTDEKFFQGSFDYLKAIRGIVSVPVLCKDFLVTPYQVYEARSYDADAVLLIVAALDDAQLADLFALVNDLGMTPLVEVHDEAELERALKLGARLIGVNNRDLHTFAVDLQTTARLAAAVPPNVTLVAESGVNSAGDVHKMGQAGAMAVLVGEGLVRSPDIASTVQELSGQPRLPA